MKEKERMPGESKESVWINPLGIVRNALSNIKERIRLFNPGQKKVFYSLLFFLFINVVILVAGIIVFSLLMKKL